jgi:hypothetical protein
MDGRTRMEPTSEQPQDVRIARFDALEDGVEFLGYFLTAESEQAELRVLET